MSSRSLSWICIPPCIRPIVHTKWKSGATFKQIRYLFVIQTGRASRDEILRDNTEWLRRCYAQMTSVARRRECWGGEEERGCTLGSQPACFFSNVYKCNGLVFALGRIVGDMLVLLASRTAGRSATDTLTQRRATLKACFLKSYFCICRMS